MESVSFHPCPPILRRLTISAQASSFKGFQCCINNSYGYVRWKNSQWESIHDKSACVCAWLTESDRWKTEIGGDLLPITFINDLTYLTELTLTAYTQRSWKSHNQDLLISCLCIPDSGLQMSDDDSINICEASIFPATFTTPVKRWLTLFSVCRKSCLTLLFPQFTISFFTLVSSSQLL